MRVRVCVSKVPPCTTTLLSTRKATLSKNVLRTLHASYAPSPLTLYVATSNGKPEHRVLEPTFDVPDAYTNTMPLRGSLFTLCSFTTLCFSSYLLTHSVPPLLPPSSFLSLSFCRTNTHTHTHTQHARTHARTHTHTHIRTRRERETRTPTHTHVRTPGSADVREVSRGRQEPLLRAFGVHARLERVP